jgi:Protein of unknown function (DUF935)
LDIVQGDADLLSDTQNSTLINWICLYNGLSPCRVSREIDKPEDLLSASQTDVNIASLGFKPNLEYIRERYGDGWEGAPAPSPLSPVASVIAPQAQSASPTSFAELALAKPAPPTDPIATTMGQAGDIVLADWMTKIAAMVQSATSTDALRDALLSAYGGLPTDQLQQVMALAFAAAELAGMDAVVTETAQGV